MRESNRVQMNSQVDYSFEPYEPTWTPFDYSFEP